MSSATTSPAKRLTASNRRSTMWSPRCRAGTLRSSLMRTRLDGWFLHNLRELVEMEDRLRACPGLNDAEASLLLSAKQHGFSDQQLAHLWHTTEGEVRRARKAQGTTAVYKLVDTCAAEF